MYRKYYNEEAYIRPCGWDIKKAWVICRYCQCWLLKPKRDLSKYRKNKGCLCPPCSSQYKSECMMRTSLKYKDKKSEWGKLGHDSRSKESLSNAVKKQWETIKSDPEKYSQLREKRSKDSKKMWKNRSPEIRDKILTALVSSNDCGRSKLSDNVKQLMMDAGIYDNFISEECFHGYFPDEINHDLKIIVEVYGDLYHCNPKKYKHEPDRYITAIQRTVQEQWDRDKKRLAAFYRNGYTVIIIWESDFHNDPNKQIQRIKDEIDKKSEIRGKI